jgi:hypothetical protein
MAHAPQPVSLKQPLGTSKALLAGAYTDLVTAIAHVCFVPSETSIRDQDHRGG